MRRRVWYNNERYHSAKEVFLLIPSAIFRLRARAALQGKWSVAILVGLAAALPSLIAQTATLLLGSAPTALLESLMNQLNAGAAVGPEQLGALVAQLTPTAGDWLSLVAMLLAPVLTLGLINYMLTILRGGADAPYTLVFSRLGCILKSIGLQLMIMLMVLLWMLPGLAVTWLPLLIAPVWRSMPLALAETIMYAGMIGAMVLGLRAAMHYSMAEFVLADEPHTGVRACIRRSVEIMHSRKMELFLLRISFVGYSLLISLATSLVSGLLGNVLGNTVSMAGQLLLNLYVFATLAVFYEAHRPRKA